MAARAVVKRGLCSGRAACRFLLIARATFFYRGQSIDPRRQRLAKRLRALLTILDEHTRECHVLRPDRAMRAADVLAWLERAIKTHGAPAFLRSDNGPEFIAREVQRWLAEQQIKTIYIDPGSPWQNGFVESFHGRFRDECLNQEQLWTLTEARVVIEDFRCHYNERRPHGKLGYHSPARFAALQRPLTPASFIDAGQTNSTQLHTNQPSD